MVIKAFKAQYRLPMKYQKITSYVGFFGVILGIFFCIKSSMLLTGWFGVDLNLPLSQLDGSEYGVYQFLGSQILVLVLSVYAGVVCVASVFSLVMCLLGKFSLREAISYTLFSKFPKAWMNPYSNL
ncbi:hypothetical protein [Vibrio cyclitrophicus]|uniref:hypothetical protein n=1 Tax=Vibrio cyclitrophicus TaxID=47951 RepID=UPI00080DCA17|nr:hypothetical protein [Vibrio cyclitrophicus]OCH44203.1 hypothetical protein A6E07_19775 [Vibrio cyclitrophicus]PMF27290.1 hypothetical protein BCV17_19085 [Vibrio cyclitrophicus]